MEFVEQPAMAPPTVKYDAAQAAAQEKALAEAAAAPLPDFGDDDDLGGL